MWRLRSASIPSKEERASVQNDKSDNSLQGVTVENLTPETAQELKLPAGTKGVVVNQVNPASRAAEAGLQPGDVIQQVNHQSVASVNEYNQAIGASKKDAACPFAGRPQRQHDVPGGVV